MTDRRRTILDHLAALEADRAALFAELIALTAAPQPEDELLTVREAAMILRTSADWLYRHANELPFTVRPGPGQLRFRRQGIQEYLRHR